MEIPQNMYLYETNLYFLLSLFFFFYYCATRRLSLQCPRRKYCVRVVTYKDNNTYAWTSMILWRNTNINNIHICRPEKLSNYQSYWYDSHWVTAVIVPSRLVFRLEWYTMQRNKFLEFEIYTNKWAYTSCVSTDRAESCLCTKRAEIHIGFRVKWIL